MTTDLKIHSTSLQSSKKPPFTDLYPFTLAVPEYLANKTHGSVARSDLTVALNSGDLIINTFASYHLLMFTHPSFH
jgi:hypothetical protein